MRALSNYELIYTFLNTYSKSCQNWRKKSFVTFATFLLFSKYYNFRLTALSCTCDNDDDDIDKMQSECVSCVSLASCQHSVPIVGDDDWGLETPEVGPLGRNPGSGGCTGLRLPTKSQLGVDLPPSHLVICAPPKIRKNILELTRCSSWGKTKNPNKTRQQQK